MQWQGSGVAAPVAKTGWEHGRNVAEAKKAEVAATSRSVAGIFQRPGSSSRSNQQECGRSVAVARKREGAGSGFHIA